MSIISWNCRGLGNLRTVQELVDLVSTKKPKMVFLMEVKVGRNQVERVKNKIQFDGLFMVDSVRGGGGLALMWKEKDWVSLMSFSRNHVDVRVNIPEMVLWRLTCFYGHPERNRRKDFWDLLKSLSNRSNLPWCCIGDFNDLLAQTEKKGRLDHPNHLIQGFRETVEQCGLHDLGMKGYLFTWEKSRGTDNWVEERLDRALATQSWLSCFDNACVFNLETPSSDHSAIFLDFLVDRRVTRRKFRFENAWLKEPDCRRLVIDSWECTVSSNIQTRLDICGRDLRLWGEKS